MNPVTITGKEMSSRKHSGHHQYVRGKLGDKTIFKCKLPGCNHYLYKEFVENKISLCNICGELFIMNKKAMLLAKPHCDGCTKPKDKAIKSIEEELLKRLE